MWNEDSCYSKDKKRKQQPWKQWQRNKSSASSPAWASGLPYSSMFYLHNGQINTSQPFVNEWNSEHSRVWGPYTATDCRLSPSFLQMGTVSPGGELDTPGCLFEMKAKVNTQRSRHTRVVLFDVAQSEQEARERKEGCAPRKWEQRLLSATHSLPRSPTRFPTPLFLFKGMYNIQRLQI